MTTTQMTIAQFKRIVPRLPPYTSVLVKGGHGIGKSDLARLIAHIIRVDIFKMKFKFPVIDRRLSQQTDGDLMGLPSILGDSTRFNPPDWFKQACAEPVFLLLDEINRADRQTLQAAFQIVLDRELNGNKLHPETRVMSTINASTQYDINEMDPALLDRFWTVNLHATVDDWIEWAQSEPLDDDPLHKGLKKNIDPTVYEFIQSTKNTWLDPDPSSDPTGTQPSRRSWDRTSLSLVGSGLIDTPESDDFFGVCAGFLGIEAATAFWNFAKDASRRISGEEIVERFENARHKLARLGTEHLNGAIDLVNKYVIDYVPKTFNTKQGNNLKEFMSLLPDELKLALWHKLCQRGTDKIELVRSLHPYVVDQLLNVFGVKAGDVGIGMTANIPGMIPKLEQSIKKDEPA